MRLFLASLAFLLTLAIGLGAGYEIRKNGEGRRLDLAYQAGFTANQEQF